MRVLLLPCLICLSGCAAGSFNPCSIPPWPVAGEKVAAELGAIGPERIPATLEWLGRVEKLHDQLEAAR